MKRVLIAATSPLARAAIEALVAAAADLQIAATVANLSDVPRVAGKLHPDLVLVRLDSIPDEPPRELVGLGMPVAVLVDDPTPGWIADAVYSGIHAVLPQDVSAAEIAAAADALAAGLVVLHPSELDAAFPARPPLDAGVARTTLTPREIEVLRMLADGLGNKEIAFQLAISEHTVKFHVASILNKLDAGTRTEAVAIGIRRGLILL